MNAIAATSCGSLVLSASATAISSSSSAARASMPTPNDLPEPSSPHHLGSPLLFFFSVFFFRSPPSASDNAASGSVRHGRS